MGHDMATVEDEQEKSKGKLLMNLKMPAHRKSVSANTNLQKRLIAKEKQ